MGTAKWRLWRYNLKIWARKREGERRSDLNDTNIAWPVGGRCGPRGEEGLAYFFQLWAFFRVCSRRFLLWNWAFSFFVVRRTLVDMWTDVDTDRRRITCAQKCLRRQIWGFFYTSLLQGRWLGLLFPAGGFSSFRLKRFCKKQKVRSKKTDWACWSKNLTTNLPVQEKNLPAHTKWSALRKKKGIKRRLYTCHSISAHAPTNKSKIYKHTRVSRTIASLWSSKCSFADNCQILTVSAWHEWGDFSYLDT